jgi:hypothetical protein
VVKSYGNFVFYAGGNFGGDDGMTDYFTGSVVDEIGNYLCADTTSLSSLFTESCAKLNDD